LAGRARLGGDDLLALSAKETFMRVPLLIGLAAAAASTLIAGASAANVSPTSTPSAAGAVARLGVGTTAARHARLALRTARAGARVEQAGRIVEQARRGSRLAPAFARTSTVPRAAATRVRAVRALQAGPPPLCHGFRATIVGTNGDDTLTGTPGRDVIAALGGNDVVYGLGQNDVICLGDGNDIAWGGAGDDTLSGGGGNDFVDGGPGNDTMDGGGQSLDAVAFFDETGPVTASLVSGTATGAGSDTFTNVGQLHGGDYADTFTGNGADNGLFGNGGNDTLNGGDGNDYLSGGSGDDTIDGGSGSYDAVTFWDATGGVTASLATGASSGGGEGNDTFTNIDVLNGGTGPDTLVGDNSDNSLWGGAGDDTLSGGGGNDFVDGGPGNDTMDGGGQSLDAVAFFDETGPVTASLVSGTATGAGSDTFTNVGQLHGGDYADTFTGNGADNGLFGNGGNDTLNGGDGNDYLSGGSGDDTIDGGSGSYDAVTFWDATGGVTASLATGASSGGGEGNDTFTNIDVLNGGTGPDTLVGDNSDNSLWGGAGDDTLSGGGGNDFLVPGSGTDTLDGGAGDADAAAYWDASGPITANLTTGASGDGSDSYANLEQIHGSPYGDTLSGDVANAWLFGNEGNDTVTGGSGNDFLFGGSGDDTLGGGSGDDFLAPGSGTDALDGGPGFDKAAYWDAPGPITASLATATASGDGNDTYTNLEGIHGGNFGDTLTGDDANNELFGNDGNDTLYGLGGDDSLNGWNGDDSLHGGPGNDYLDGGDGVDALDGGADFDTCIAGETFLGCEAPPNVGRTDLALGGTATASGEYPGDPASLAIDGDWWSYWSSGNFPPQWIEVDLGSVKDVGEIDLGVTQLPDSFTDHRLYGRASASDPFTLLAEFSGYTVDQQLLRYVATTPQPLRFVRVETTSSASWVGWREIAVYAPGS
jgi:Ca2+-binding RTX toxin-like protein